MLKNIATSLLDVVYDEQGDPDGWPVVLLHGFPYDIHAYDEVSPRLASQGARVITPYLRGYGPTRFLRAVAVGFHRAPADFELRKSTIDNEPRTKSMLPVDEAGLSVASQACRENILGTCAGAAYAGRNSHVIPIGREMECHGRTGVTPPAMSAPLCRAIFRPYAGE